MMLDILNGAATAGTFCWCLTQNPIPLTFLI